MPGGATTVSGRRCGAVVAGAGAGAVARRRRAESAASRSNFTKRKATASMRAPTADQSARFAPMNPATGRVRAFRSAGVQ
jgi:hypothetical protein